MCLLPGSQDTIPSSLWPSVSPASWSVGNWSVCSRTCGGGTQSRPVRCTRRAHYRDESIPASLCPQPEPPIHQACNSQSCPPAWSTGPWAEVTRWAGKGWWWLDHTPWNTFTESFAHLLSYAVLKDLWEGVEEEDSGLQKHQPLSSSPAVARHCLHFRTQASDPRNLPAQALPQAQEATVAGICLVPGMFTKSAQNGIHFYSPSCLLPPPLLSLCLLTLSSFLCFEPVTALIHPLISLPLAGICANLPPCPILPHNDAHN